MSVNKGVSSVARRLSWVVGVLLAASLAITACGSDSSTGGGGGPSTSGAAGEAGAVDSIGGAGSAGADTGGDAGMSPVEPGDLVCTSSADCKGDKPVCDPVLGCVACIYDWDCPANDRCEANQCYAKKACTESKECKSEAQRPLCDPVQKVCVGCRADGDCGQGERCAGSSCEQLEACTNSHDCGHGKVCDRQLGACVACVVDGDCGPGDACVADACVPTCKSDKQCLGIGLLCSQELGRCVECVNQADCPSDYYCGSASKCLPDVCAQGDAHCNGGHTLSSCSLLGDQFEDATCASDTACSEDNPTTAACAPLVCEPSSVQCTADKGAVVTCSDDGLSVKKTDPCGVGQACVSAECRDVVCPPGEDLCEGSDLLSCNASGTQKTKITTCGLNYKCDAQAGACTPPQCVAGTHLCDGNTATVCAEDGSGPAPGGTLCSNGMACSAGSCLPVVCTGAYQCTDANLFKCANNGTSAQLQSICSAPGLCDAAGAKCLTAKCTPGAFACDGNIATRCKSDGSGYEAGGTDCSLSNLACDGGGCLPKVCTSNATFCQAGSPNVCNAAGTTYAPSDTCTASEYCDPSSKFCLTDKCTASAPVCSGNLLTTCAADGSGPIAGGTDCSASGTLCVAGACKAVVCAKGTLSCQGEALYLCNESGTGTTLYQTCAVSQFCDTSAEVATCAADICSAGGLGCSQEVISTCGANGGSWTNPGTNCATNGQVCVLGGSCAAQEVAVAGSNTYSSISYSGGLQLSGFRALSSRKLTQIEINASVSGVQKLTWVVYQKRVGSEAYDLVYQRVTAQSAPSIAWLSSGALDFNFVAGKSYAVGVHITGNSSVSSGYGYGALPAKAGFIAAAFNYTQNSSTNQPASTLNPSTNTYYNSYLRFTTAVGPN